MTRGQRDRRRAGDIVTINVAGIFEVYRSHIGTVHFQALHEVRFFLRIRTYVPQTDPLFWNFEDWIQFADHELQHLVCCLLLGSRQQICHQRARGCVFSLVLRTRLPFLLKLPWQVYYFPGLVQHPYCMFEMKVQGGHDHGGWFQWSSGANMPTSKYSNSSRIKHDRLCPVLDIPCAHRRLIAANRGGCSGVVHPSP